MHHARWEQPRLPAQRYGYVWVAPHEHDLEQPQRDALSAAGCARIWTDRPQGPVSAHAPAERGRLLAYLQPRDVLVVWRLDRLARNAAELAEIAAALRTRKIALRSITDELDSTGPGGEQLFAAITAIAQLEPAGATGHERPRTARVGARKGGRPRLLDEQGHATVRLMYEAGQHTIDQIADQHGVSRPTVYRSLKRTQASHNAF